MKKREAFMVRLRKDRKDQILNEKRRKLYTPSDEATQLFDITSNAVEIDCATEIVDKNSRRSHHYIICPLF